MDPIKQEEIYKSEKVPKYFKRHTIPSPFKYDTEISDQLDESFDFISEEACNGIVVQEYNEGIKKVDGTLQPFSTFIWIEKDGFTIQGKLLDSKADKKLIDDFRYQDNELDMSETEDLSDSDQRELGYLHKECRKAAKTRIYKFQRKRWCIPLWQLQQVRAEDRNTPGFNYYLSGRQDTGKEELDKELPPDNIVSIFYGQQADMKLKQCHDNEFYWYGRSFVFPSNADAVKWKNAFKYIQYLWHTSSSKIRQEIYLSAYYHSMKMAKNQKKKIAAITKQTFKQFVSQALNVDVNNKLCKTALKSLRFSENVNGKEAMNIRDFVFNSRKLQAAAMQPMTEELKVYFNVQDGKKFTHDDLKRVLIQNGDTWVDDEDQFQNFLYDTFENTSEPTFDELVNYFFSDENTAFDPHQLYTPREHDMHQSMTDYYINSSHNTYLVGDQLFGLSSVEAYIRCLLLGSRCI